MTVLALTLAAACRTDPSVPVSSEIHCASNADCPPSYTCKSTIERCVQAGGDATAPAVVGGTVTPARAGIGATLTATFDVTKPLLGVPRVYLAPAGGLLQFTLATQDASHFVYEHVISGAEGDGAPLPVLVDMLDTTGNQATGLALGNVVFDFTLPVVADVRAGQPYAKAGDVVTITFHASEDLAGVAVALADGTPFVADPSPGALTHSASLSLTGREPEGPTAVDIHVTDLAGNEAAFTFPSVFVTDFTPPVVLGTPVVARAFVTQGQTAGIELTVSEPLGGDPAVTMVGSAATVSLVAAAHVGTSYSFTRQVVTADVDGPYELWLTTFADVAGNAGAAQRLGTVTIDRVPPSFVVAPVTDRASESHQAGFDTLVLTFSLGEVAASVDAAVEGVPLTCEETASAIEADYTCTYHVGASDPPGLHGVAVTVADAAGNIAFATAAPVLFDYTPPSLVLSVIPPGRAARAGEIVAITVAANEPLSTAGVTLVAGGLALGPPVVSGQSYVWTHVVGTSEQGTFSLSASATDLAGNPSAAPATGQATLDGIAPSLILVHLSQTGVAAGQAFSASFTASEPLGATPIVRFGNGADAAVDMAATTALPGYDYTFVGTAPASGTGASPNYVVSALIADAAGNQATIPLGTVVIDNVPPTLAGLDLAPAGAKLGDVVHIVVTADETLQGPPAVTATGPGGPVAFVAKDTTPGQISYGYSLLVTSGTAQGTYTVQPFDLVDVAGNTRRITPTATFSVDSTAPRVLSVVATPSFAKNGDELTVSFKVSEVLPSDPVVSLDSHLFGKTTPLAGYDYSYRLVVDSAQETEGFVTVAVAIADAAGNTGYGGTSVELDFTPPHVAGATATPNPAPLGALVVLQVVASEALGSSPTLHVTPALTMTGPVASGLSYTWTHPVAAGDTDGAYAFTVDLVDAAGNPAPARPAGSLSIDRTPPTAALVSLSPTVAKAGTTVTVALDQSETLAATPTVTIGGLTMTAVSPAGADWQFERVVVAPADGEGVKPVTAVVTDLAGNVASYTLGVVTFDFTPPVVAQSQAQLSPGVDNPLTRVSAVTVGTTVTISLTMSEPVAVLPAVTTVSPQSLGTFDLRAGTVPGTAFVYDFTLSSASVAQGAYTVAVTTTDLAGNSATDDVVVHPTYAVASGASFSVDTLAPAAPDTTTSGLTTYYRFPWGAAATSGKPEFDVWGKAGAAPADATLIIAYDSTGAEIGRTTVSGTSFGAAPGGPGAFELSASDRWSVSLASVDAAGNTSTVVPVRDGLWTATTGYKVAGSLFENPHVFSTRTWLGPARVQADAVETASVPHGQGGTGPRVVGGVELREHTFAPTAPSARSAAGMVYDSSRSVVVLQGGGVAGGADSSTWEWDGASWVERVPTDPESDGNPPALRGFGFAYDEARQRAVLFGGVDAGGLAHGDTWEWDGASWAHRATTGPGARIGFVMTYDSVRRQTVLFGGNGGSGALSDTWVWDGGAWSQCVSGGAVCNLVGASPPARANASMVFDEKRGVAVMEGGYVASSDIWEWNGTSWSSSTGVSYVNQTMTMAYDIADQYTVSYISDLGSSVWDGTSYVSLPAATLSPARVGGAAAYDRRHRQVLLFGGYEPSSSTYFGEGYIWGGTGWWLVGAPPSPPLYSSSVANNLDGSTVLVMRGAGETWQWDGLVWSLVYGGGGTPSISVGGGSMAYDRVRDEFIELDGSHNETWRFNGGGWDCIWGTACPGHEATGPILSGTRLATNPGGGVVLFGGYKNPTGKVSSTWVWNGTTWAQLSPAHAPSARVEQVMAFDPAHGVAVMFGGNDTSTRGDTWLWDGADWAPWSPVDPEGDGNPVGRERASMVFDEGRQRLLLYGGVDAGYHFLSDLWEWTGTSWRRLPSSDPWGRGVPAARDIALLAYDGRTVMMFGGYGQLPSGTTFLNDTWTIDAGAAQRPAETFAVSFTAGHFGGTVEGVATTWTAGGVGPAGPGAQLLVWDRGYWSPVGTPNAAASSAPAALTWSTVDPTQLDRLPIGPAGTVTFAVAPVSANGTARAQVAVDYAEVQVSYRQ